MIDVSDFIKDEEGEQKPQDKQEERLLRTYETTDRLIKKNFSLQKCICSKCNQFGFFTGESYGLLDTYCPLCKRRGFKNIYFL